MAQRRCRMEVTRTFQRHKKTILSLVWCLLFVVLLFAIHKRLVYLENNIFSSQLIDVPYAADYKPRSTKIPKIIHQTWISTAVPQQFSGWVASWHSKNPEFQYWFWTDDDARKLIAEKYPAFLALFDSYPFNIQRADVIRYFVLYEYGGLYSDLDVEVVKSLGEILDESCYLSQEPLEHAYFFWGMRRLACNAIMACRPRHPYFKQVIENLKYYKGLSIAPFVKVSMPVMESSGPKMVTYNLDKYEKSVFSLEIQNKVNLWPAKFFFPDADSTCMPYVKRQCSNAGLREKMSVDQKKVCEYHEMTQYSNKQHPNPYAYHHWSHTYYGVDKSPGNVQIKEVIPGVRLAKDVLLSEGEGKPKVGNGGQ